MGRDHLAIGDENTDVRNVMHGTEGVAVQTGTARKVWIGDSHDQRGLYALGVVVVLLLVAGIVVIERLTATNAVDVAAAPAAVSDLRIICGSGWVIPDRVTRRSRPVCVGLRTRCSAPAAMSS